MSLIDGKPLLSAAGILCVILGAIGIFLPLLPTTPFLLLAAWLFMRSSPRLHEWLTRHPRLGPFISAWQDGAGLEVRVRTRIICALWLGMGISMLIVGKLWAVFLLGTIGICVTVYILRQPVYDRRN